jgi:hypothetical protein
MLPPHTRGRAGVGVIIMLFHLFNPCPTDSWLAPLSKRRYFRYPPEIALGSINYREVFIMIEKQLRKLSLTVAFLDEKSQIQFLKHWLKEIKDRRSLIEEILNVAANAYYPTAKVEKWMESRLGKDISLTPRRVAYEYRYYKAIDKRMEPYLRRIARKVKNRLLIRSRRSAMKNKQETL